MKGDHQVIVAIVIFFIGTFFGFLISDKPFLLSFKDYLPAIATLIAAFLGARYAYILNLAKEQRDEKKKNIVAGNLAVFNLIRMLNVLLDYQNQIIAPVRDKPLAFIEMQPTLHLLEDDINLDLNQLSFLLNSGDPNLLGELAAEKSKFKRTLDTINERSQHHIDRLQPIAEKYGMREKESYTLSQFEETLGPQLFVTMRQSTKEIIESVDSTILSIQIACGKLTSVLKKIFPNETIISYSLPHNNP